MKKRITQAEWEYIGKYNPAAKWIRPFCSYFLVKTENGFRRECKINLLIYLITFIPAHLFAALYCMWDGGLKEFEFAGRLLGYDDIRDDGYDSKTAFTIAKEIWEKKERG